MLRKTNSRIKNAMNLPRRYYGLHMVEGVAEYKDKVNDKGGAYRVMVNSDTIKNMDASFTGRPVYVNHVNEVDMDKIQEADGFVVKSFYNKSDGNHWAEFLVVSDAGHEAIRNGWKLSNAYLISQKGPGGQRHGVDYDDEVKAGEYEHLGIVQNPRYNQSVILTPEEFTAYNKTKDEELLRFANSNEGEKEMFNIFQKQKVENSADLSGMSVELPKSKKEVTLKALINEADKAEMDKDKPVMANGDHMVKADDKEMSVNEMIEKYNSMCKAKNEEEKEELENEEEEELENEEEKEDLENEEEEKEKAENAIKNVKKLKNAQANAIKNQTVTVDLSFDRASRGKTRYGS